MRKIKFVEQVRVIFHIINKIINFTATCIKKSKFKTIKDAEPISLAQLNLGRAYKYCNICHVTYICN